MTEGKYTVILVHSTSYAIRAERVLNMAEIPSKLIPVPRHLSSDCGVCVRIAREHQEAALQALESAGAETIGIHEI